MWMQRRQRRQLWDAAASAPLKEIPPCWHLCALMFVPRSQRAARGRVELQRQEGFADTCGHS